MALRTVPLSLLTKVRFAKWLGWYMGLAFDLRPNTALYSRFLGEIRDSWACSISVLKKIS